VRMGAIHGSRLHHATRMELAAFLVDDSRGPPGIGDPTPQGWITVLAYFAAA
jgi:hypothetical protein